jgi:hypothetical protein
MLEELEQQQQQQQGEGAERPPSSGGDVAVAGRHALLAKKRLLLQQQQTLREKQLLLELQQTQGSGTAASLRTETPPALAPTVRANPLLAHAHGRIGNRHSQQSPDGKGTGTGTGTGAAGGKQYTVAQLEQSVAAQKRLESGALERGDTLWQPLKPRLQAWIARDEHKLARPPAHVRLKLAITIAIEANETSIFVNGAKQAAFFLFETLAPRHDVWLINLDTSGNIHSAPKDMHAVAAVGKRVIGFEAAAAMGLDVVVEQGMQLSQRQLDTLQAGGTKVASFRTGNDFVFLTEQVLFRSQIKAMQGKKAHTTLFDTTGYDQVWCIPSFCQHQTFLRTLFRSPVLPSP